MEIGIPHRYLSDDAIPPTRIVIGIGTAYAFQRLHRTRPRTARWLAGVFTVINLAVARHNYAVADRLSD